MVELLVNPFTAGRYVEYRYYTCLAVRLTILFINRDTPILKSLKVAPLFPFHYWTTPLIFYLIKVWTACWVSSISHCCLRDAAEIQELRKFLGAVKVSLEDVYLESLSKSYDFLVKLSKKRNFVSFWWRRSVTRRIFMFQSRLGNVSTLQLLKNISLLQRRCFCLLWLKDFKVFSVMKDIVIHLISFSSICMEQSVKYALATDIS